jgi:GGDEF domain-containing protein
MNGLRFWVLVLVVWLPLMVAVEHALVPAAYQHNILLLLLSMVAVVLLTPKPLPNRWVLFAIVGAFIGVAMLYNGIEDEIENPFLTSTRVTAILLTGWIAHQINLQLYKIERAIAAFALTDYSPLPTDFADAQPQIYRELQRARHHERPLALVVMQLDEKSATAALPKVVEEVCQSLERKLLLAKVARILDDKLPRFHAVALRKDCFVAAMPETSAAEARELMQGVSAAAATSLNLTLYSGVASLADDANTFETLVELAEQKMYEARTARQSADPRQLLFPMEPSSVEPQAER